MLVDIFFSGDSVTDSVASLMVLVIVVGGIISAGYLISLARRKNV